MEGALNSGDTAWLLVCCSLVLLMTPALALFYGGMARRKNLLSTLTLSYMFMALAGSSGSFTATPWPSGPTSAA
jgi:ammonium transporter, Amt family